MIKHQVAGGGVEAALAARVRQQAAVAQLGLRALACADLDQLLEAVVAVLAEGLGVEYAKLLELLPDGTALLLRAGVGWRAGLVGRTTVGARIDSQAGYTLHEGKPVIVDDLREERRFRGPPLLLEHGVVSGLSVIIHGRERPFGVLGAHTTRRQTFSEDDLNFLQAIANVVAAAVEREHVKQEREHLAEQVGAERAALAASEAAETRYRTLFERAADAVVVVDASGQVVDANATAIQLLGYSREELLNVRLGEGTLVAPAWARAEFARLERDGFWAGELEVRRKDGSLVPVDARVTRVELPGGPVYRGTWRDLSGWRVMRRVAFDESPDGHDGAAALTPRELDVAAQVASGKTNAEIAESLVLSTGTVANYVHRILGKLGLSTRAQLAVWVVEHGLRPAAPGPEQGDGEHDGHRPSRP